MSFSTTSPWVAPFRRFNRMTYLAAAGVLAVVFILVVVFWGNSVVSDSHVTGVPDVSTLPGRAGPNQKLTELAVEAAQRQAEEAKRQKDSYLVSLNAAKSTQASQTQPPAAAAAPSSTPQVLGYASKDVSVPDTTQHHVETARDNNSDQADPKYTALFGTLMAGMAPDHTAFGVELTTEALSQRKEAARKEAEERLAYRAQGEAGRGDIPGGGRATDRPRVLMPALHWSMAKTMMATDTDGAGGPVVVEMIGGPLKGARLLGTAQRRGERMAVSLTSMEFQGRGSVPVDAVLISPETGESAVASSVDHHYAARLLFPSLASAAAGAGQAVGLSGSTQFVSPYGGGASYGDFNAGQIAAIGVGAAGRSLEQVLREMAPTGPTVHLYKDEVVGVMFLKDVVLDARG